MLVVTRKKDEKLMIGDDIEVQVLRIGRENVRLGIKAPANVPIYRYEIYEAIQQREAAAASSETPAASSETPAAESPTPAPAATEPATPAEEEGEATESPKVRAHSES